MRETIERRRVQQEFVARGLASLQDARRTGVYYTADQVHGELSEMLARAKKRLKP